MSKYRLAVRYNMRHNTEFQQTLKKRVDALILSKGGNTKAGLSMHLRVIGLLVTHVGVWSLLALHSFSLASTLGLISLFALISQTIVCNIVHEAGHTGITGNKKMDDFLTWLSCGLMGVNPRLYQMRHNEAHHMFTNIPGLDTDIEASKIIRFVPNAEWKPYHRYQHIYGPILYSLFTLQWVLIKDFRVFKQHELGNLINVTHTRFQKLSMYLMKLGYLTYMIGIPALVLPYTLGQVILGFALYHLILSMMFTLMIGGLHIFEGTEFVMFNEKNELPYSFMEHSLRTSAEFYPRSKIAGFFFCAFNTHAIHHMFPNMSSVHYPEISKILKVTAKEHRLTYHDFTFLELVVKHLKFVKYMGSHPNAGSEYIKTHPIAPPIDQSLPGLRFKLSSKSGNQSQDLVS